MRIEMKKNQTERAAPQVRHKDSPDAGGKPKGPPKKSSHVLDNVHAFLGRFVVYPSPLARVAHTLWIAHTHGMNCWDSTPRLAFLSPEPGSGKTRAIEVTATLVAGAVHSVNATPAYVMRKMADTDEPSTILYDEVDALFQSRATNQEEIRAMINAGHRRGAMAGRCVRRGNGIETEELSAYCAVAVAGLGSLPDTILSRSIVIMMQPRRPDEKVEAFRPRTHVPEGEALREELATWMSSAKAELTRSSPEMPGPISDRNADVWEPLLATADAAGGRWPKLARLAAIGFVEEARRTTASLGVTLLRDIRVAMANEATIRTKDLLTRLNAMEEAPWGTLNGAPLDARELATLLKQYDIKSSTVRTRSGRGKGFSKKDFHGAWERYLPADEKDPDPGPNGADKSRAS